MMSALLVVVVCCSRARARAHGALPYQNTNLGWDARRDDLVSRMTLQEIQVQLASGQGESPENMISFTELDLVDDVDTVHPATGYPQFIGLGASFDSDLVYRIAEATSIEVAHYERINIHRGISCFSPKVDVFRDPRWGRGQCAISDSRS
ncbi:uncharacterized protein [Haliotis cracherodii]|uniref:uncharacterized protein n=1 Tax=Haliotis cracherodii TaxID=6455 RepID=UPI0039EC3555